MSRAETLTYPYDKYAIEACHFIKCAQLLNSPRMTALCRDFIDPQCLLMADQRPILGPEAAVQPEEPGTVGIRQISTEAV